MIGSALATSLAASGHRVVRLVRGGARGAAPEVSWDPAAGVVDAASLEGLDAVIHLAGENIGAKRWTAARKAAIRDSRSRGTRLLCETLARLDRPPKVLLCASAVGYYGDRGDETLDESAPRGVGFLAEVCGAWEAATEPAARRGIRVALLRFGVVLSASGGALPRMLVPFRLGLGGRVGSGRQWMSWVTLDDAVAAIRFALLESALERAVNVVAPEPVTNRTFTRILGRVLGRPALLPAPGFALRLALGEMAGELLLASQRVRPARLLEAGFEFRHADLEGALRHELGIPRAR